MASVEIVSATRQTEQEFATSPLGVSLQRLQADDRLTARVTMNNTAGLSSVYNHAMSESTADVMLFIHDDVWIEDQFIVDRLIEGLNSFNIIGVAGNRRPTPGLLAWYGDDPRFLSGWVSHGKGPLGKIRAYGPAPRACELLDGLFIAVDLPRLRQSGVTFDERFTFDFYDLDFCRSARKAGLTIGTWPISVTHRSGGTGAGGERWQTLSGIYAAKWPD